MLSTSTVLTLREQHIYEDAFQRHDKKGALYFTWEKTYNHVIVLANNILAMHKLNEYPFVLTKSQTVMARL